MCLWGLGIYCAGYAQPYWNHPLLFCAMCGIGIRDKRRRGEVMRDLVIYSENDGYQRHLGGIKIFRSSSGPSETVALTLSGDSVPAFLGMIVSSLKAHGLRISESGVYYRKRDFSKLSRSKKLRNAFIKKDGEKPKKTELDIMAKV
jgi:hypothetical protein